MDASLESGPEAAAPRRPSAVPAGSVWNAEADKWEVSRRDAAGARDGECLLYRDDGTLYSRTQFVAGVQDGPFVIYHRNGDVAREGRSVGGAFDGTVTAYASDDPGGEVLRNCCVPPGASRLSQRWRAGDFLLEVFYDREGRAILSDGRLCPARPDGLPELAQFDESRGGWSLRSRELDRSWDADGLLIEEVIHAPGGSHGTGGARVFRRFDADGLLQENGVSAQSGDLGGDRLDGPFFRRFPASEPSPYADARIRQERGAYADGQAVGSWTFLDGDGNVVRTVDRGTAYLGGADARSLTVLPSPASQPNEQPNEQPNKQPNNQPNNSDWWSLARCFAADGHVREALVAAARAAVTDRDRTALVEFRAARVVPLTAEREAQWGGALAQSTDATIPSILDALVCGADAAAAYRTLASVLPGTDPAALELVEASLLLAPDRRMTHLTRALLRFQRGDVAGALADADVVAGESAEAAESLRSYAMMVFRGFDDWPRRERLAPEPGLDGVALELTHDADVVRQMIAVYATRLARARAAVRALVGEGRSAETPAWLPPDTSPLLPSGPVSLRRETVTCDPDPDAPAGNPPDTIQIDEEPAVDGAGVPALIAAAQADWAALSWLCWAVGLDSVRLPDAIGRATDLPAAMQLFVRRTWRIKDRLTSGSLISRSQGVPGFEWQGVDIDALPRHLVEMAAAEYVAVRSMFIWLASPDALSPFQDDIRDA